MCNITTESIKLAIDVFSALLTPTIALCTYFILKQQKNIQDKQHKTNIYKLRVEHGQQLINYWRDYNAYIYHDDKIAIIVPYNTSDFIIYTMKNAVAEILKHNLFTTKLFNEELYKLEGELQSVLYNMIPQNLSNQGSENITEQYIKAKNLFNKLYDEYKKIIDSKGIL